MGDDGVIGYHETELGQHDRWMRHAPDLFEKYTQSIEDLRLVRGAMEADDERLRIAAEKVGVVAGCDAPDEMADIILGQQKDIELLKAQLTGNNTPLMDLAEDLWGVVANAGHGDWDKETVEWRRAAERCRDRYFAVMGRFAVRGR
jgi:hypothetical protein